MQLHNFILNLLLAYNIFLLHTPVFTHYQTTFTKKILLYSASILKLKLKKDLFSFLEVVQDAHSTIRLTPWTKRWCQAKLSLTVNMCLYLSPSQQPIRKRVRRVFANQKQTIDLVLTLSLSSSVVLTALHSKSTNCFLTICL